VQEHATLIRGTGGDISGVLVLFRTADRPAAHADPRAEDDWVPRGIEAAGGVPWDQDLPQRAPLELKLRDSHAQLQAALAAGGIGTFRWDLATNALEWDENLERLAGLAPGLGPRSLLQFVALVHPDDRTPVSQQCQLCVAEGAPLDADFRVVWPDGQTRWLSKRGRTMLDARGRPHQVTGVGMDVTDRRVWAPPPEAVPAGPSALPFALPSADLPATDVTSPTERFYQEWQTAISQQRGDGGHLRRPAAADAGEIPTARGDREVARPAPVQAVPRAGRRLLIVDSDPEAAEGLAFLLTVAGNEVRTAEDGLEAVQAAAVFGPEVVLLDLGLPGLDGFEAARRIRQQSRGRPPLLIALMAWDRPDLRLRAGDAGFDRCIPKPVDLGAIQDLLDSLVPAVRA
jgi:CheY-like chemotaxis protein/PAS domain-containing protein